MSEKDLKNTPGAASTGGAPSGSETGNTGNAQQPTAPTPQQPTPQPPKKEETVTVPKDLLEQVLKNQEDMKAERQLYKDEIERLTYAADKSRLGIYDARNTQGQLIRTMSVGQWTETDKETGQQLGTSYILGWKMTVDDVNIEENGGIRRLVEKQVIRLFLDDGLDENDKQKVRELDVDYVKFYRNVKRVKGEVVREARDENGEYRTLRMPDGKTLEMDIRFVNL